ncbi:MAG: magnesium transporter [Sedimenticolaceae bacterium]
MTEPHQQPVRTEIEIVRQALEKGKYKRIRKLLRGMHPAKVASLLESLESGQRSAMWQQVDDDAEQKVLAHVSEELRAFFRQDRERAQETLEPEMDTHTELTRLRDALRLGKLKRVRRMLQQIHPAKAAGLLESVPPGERSTAWDMVESEEAGRILVNLHEEVRTRLALEMDPEDLSVAARGMKLDDLVDLIQDLPEENGQDLLRAMDLHAREQLESMLTYPEDSAGGLMNTDQIAVREDLHLGSVLRYLRLLNDLADNTDKLMVVDRNNQYQGVLRLRRLLTSRPQQRVKEVMDHDFEPIPADMQSREVVRRFEDLDLISSPVVDADGRLLGRITVDDVMDVIREESERSLMHAAGLDEEVDMFAPVLTSTRRRALWLGINLVTAFMAAWVIGLFEGTLEKVVALAVLMPIVASMGGIAGSQTLTLVIRGLALGHLQRGNAPVLLWKEFGVGTLNGLIWALVVAALAILWFESWQIGGIIAAAILLNMLCAALAGVAIPLVLSELDIDPALAGGVILTTVTDVVGFFAFLGLATLILL